MQRFIASLCVCLVGCSLLVDSSINRLKCAVTVAGGVTQKTCSPNFSCYADECYADGSIKEGKECAETKQCEAGLICPDLIGICGKPCTKIYDPASECGPNKACAPVVDAKSKGKFAGGVCIAVECMGPADDKHCIDEGGHLSSAGPANGCVKVASNGGLCLPRCTIGKRAIDDPKGVDQCTTDGRMNVQHCGRVLTGDAVCMPVGAAAEGSRCSLYPQTTSAAAEDACDVGTPGLPLLCLNAKGTASEVDGPLSCRRVACEVSADTTNLCPSMQICAETPGLRICRGPQEK